MWYLFLGISHTILQQILFSCNRKHFILRCFTDIDFVDLNIYPYYKTFHSAVKTIDNCMWKEARNKHTGMLCTF